MMAVIKLSHKVNKNGRAKLVLKGHNRRVLSVALKYFQPTSTITVHSDAGGQQRFLATC